MSIISSGFNAVGKLLFLIGLLIAFAASMAGVVYMSLSGSEIKVPDIVGKDFVESEKELAALGLKIKRRADRPSSQPMNSVVEQLPRAGETVKTGQLILVVTSKAGVDAGTPKSLIEDIESDDTKKIEEMISDKPKRTRTPSNTNTEKKTADTKRDVIANTSSGSDTGVKADDGDKPKPDSSPKAPDTAPSGDKTRDTSPKPPANTQQRDQRSGDRPPTRPATRPATRP